MTRGIKSSEFVVCVLGTLLGGGMAFYGIQSGEILASLSLAAAFITQRGAVKWKNGEDKTTKSD